MERSNRTGQRTELGQVSRSTRGSVYGTVEKIGLFQPAASLDAR